ncbi:GTPase Era [Parasphingopyxis lamellibrachiae]|uniref:GTPase Era n=1 Tax=Parasphingopyxis lamellibrachiae TaxID=680125 RepID=A0A3D9FIW8_9SPHN|nr:GTPase Era [Parasphingopyxis lamellibrachiae]RED17739.1 GTP-binding protein Era [Parasphingopyxis lamellibrachiae]
MSDINNHHCGFVAIVGAPNAGKSTLVNTLIGQKVAITSAKAQTTRTRLMGILVEDDTQIVLIDTPGIFAPKRRLDRAMVSAAWGGAEGADLIALIIDAKAGLKGGIEAMVESLRKRPEPKLLVLNKVDIAKKDELLRLAAGLNALLDPVDTFFVSATTGDGVDDLKKALVEAMPEGMWHFPADQVSDASQRLLAAEVTREQLYHQLRNELPYASAVDTESYTERKDGSVEIRQQILVARPTQKAIVLGKGGSRIKEIGQKSREELGEILGCKVHLFLHVKVKPDWEEDQTLYRDIGLDWVE